MRHCIGCGIEVHESAVACPKCGCVFKQPEKKAAKSKSTAAILALFLGGLGIHRFYLGQWWGIWYLLFVWTFIPCIVSFIEGIVFACRSEEDWNKVYGV